MDSRTTPVPDRVLGAIATVHPSDGSLPEGQSFHAAGPSAGGCTIVAIHDSQEGWERFRDGVLGPRMTEGGTSPGIGKSAWFMDPDGNTIALFQPE